MSQNVSAQVQTPVPLGILNVVPPGRVFGPLLFLLYFNENPSIFLDAVACLFADDPELLSRRHIFMIDLARLNNWILTNGIVANFSKTRTMIFRSITFVILNDKTSEKISVQKDRGVTVSSYLIWDSHVEVRFSEARKTLLLKCIIPQNTSGIIWKLLVYGAIRAYLWF